jgi:acyl carrier protein
MTQELKEVIADILGLDVTDVGDEFSRDTADNWDSLNHLRIITAVEQSFAVSFTMEEIQMATNVRQLADMVSRKST